MTLLLFYWQQQPLDQLPKGAQSWCIFDAEQELCEAFLLKLSAQVPAQVQDFCFLGVVKGSTADTDMDWHSYFL